MEYPALMVALLLLSEYPNPVLEEERTTYLELNGSYYCD